MSAAVAYFQRLGTEASAGWDRFWFTPASPAPLARLRIAIGLIALAYFLSWTADLSRMFAGDGLLPPGSTQQLLHERANGRIHYHLSPLFSVDSSSGLYVYHVASLAVALLLTLGAFTRVSCLLTLLAVLMLVHRAPMLTGPLETVLVFLLLYLLVGPSGAALSFDCRRVAKDRTPLAAPSWTANVSLRLMQVHLAGFIFLVACSMLGSRFWWNGEALWSLEAQELSRPFDLSWLRDFPKLINGWTHLFVLINLLFPILVWNRLLRPLVVTLGIVAWALMIPLTGQVLYVAAVITAMCAFLADDPPSATSSEA
jgi:hypothetical protein